MAAAPAALFVVDHPRLFRNYRHQTVTLDAASADETELTAGLKAIGVQLGFRLGIQNITFRIRPGPHV